MHEKPRVRSVETNNFPERIQKALERLEQLNILPQDKVIALLTFAGLKRVGHIMWMTNDRSDEKRDNLLQVITDLGMQCRLDRRELSKGTEESVLFGRDPELLERLHDTKHVIDEMGRHRSHRIYGEAFGFPSTAIDAFERQEWLKALPEDVAHTPVGIFYQRAVAMRLSRDHWRDELQTVEEWRKTVEQLAPHLHTEILNSPPKRGGGH